MLEMPILEKNLIALSTIASISTMLGLLGTVIGMIRAFRALAQAGAPDAIALSIGISEALINTALGIFVKQEKMTKVGEPEDIARTVGFLVADAPYVTGIVLPVDGGRHLRRGADDRTTGARLPGGLGRFVARAHRRAA